MILTKEQLKEYFERIDYTPGEDETPEQILRNLHVGHVSHIPYENLDTYRGMRIDLSDETLFDKQVRRKRGGYCFEMNGMFAMVLRSLGFNFKRVSARLNITGDGFGAYMHCAAIVTIGEKRFIADVGCGSGGFAEPLEIIPGHIHNVIGGTFRIVEDEKFGYVIQWKRSGSEELTDYMCVQDLEAMQGDFELGSFYGDTHPTSKFRHTLMLAMTLPTLDGKVTLSDECVRITRNGEAEIIPHSTAEEINAACLKYFGLDAPIPCVHPLAYELEENAVPTII